MGMALLAAAAGDTGVPSSTNGLLLVAGLGLAAFVIGRLTAGWLSEVVAFIAIGIVVGPQVLGLIGPDDLLALDAVVSFALGAIVFGLGARLELPKLRAVRKTLVPLALADILVTFLAVFGLTVVVGAPVAVAFLLAAIAVSTSPSTLLAVIAEVRGHGMTTDHLEATAALNNVASAVLFGLGLPIVLAGEGGPAVGALAFVQLAVAAVGIGTVAAFALRWSYGSIHHVGERLLLVVLVILAIEAVSQWFGAPVVLSTLVAGAVLANDPRDTAPVFDTLRQLDAPIFMVFFLVAGAGIHLDELLTMGIVGSAAVVGRLVGKLAGGWIGARAAGPLREHPWAPGLGQMPFAGMAIGLAAFTLDKANQVGADDLGTLVSAVVFGSVVVFELAGPPAVKKALQMAGEVGMDVDETVQLDRSAPHQLRHVMFPVSNAAMAHSKAAVVADLSASCAADLVVLHVVPVGTEADDDEVRSELQVIGDACTARGVDYRLVVVESASVLEAIVGSARSEGVDLVAIGEPTGRFATRHRLVHAITRELSPDIHVMVLPTVDGVDAQDPALPSTNSTRARA